MRGPQRAFYGRLTGTLLISVGLLFGASLTVAQERRETILALAARAESFEAQGRWEAAAAEYQKILKIDPHSTPALNALGALSVRQGKFKEGIRSEERRVRNKW